MEPFKNWLGFKAAERIAQALHRSKPSFSKRDFLAGLEKELAPLELKGRMRLLKSRLKALLPSDPRQSIPHLMEALRQSPEDKVGLAQFEVWPLTQYVADEGQAHFELSMEALKAMTKVFSSEFAIRSFLIQQESKTLAQLQAWTEESNEHVRRLVSEGSRPLLPWGEKLPGFVKDPSKTCQLLEQLRMDPSRYVRKSVANHINDHTKHHADWVIHRLSRWRKDHSQSEEIDWIIRHGTRTLVKKGHSAALRLQGVFPSAIVLNRWRVLTPKVRLGRSLGLEAILHNPGKKSAKAIVDIELQLRGSRDQTRSKVFKGIHRIIEASQMATFRMNIPLKAVTTRRYYSGDQGCRLLVNGCLSAALSFRLLVPGRALHYNKPHEFHSKRHRSA